MLFFPHQKFKLSNYQVATSLNDETVILNTSKGMYYNLNEVGTLIWNTIEKKGEIDFTALQNIVLENFDIDEDNCKTDITNLLTDLINEKLVEKVD